MGANFSPCLTLLTALVSITSALGMFNNPRETDKYQHDLLDTLVQVMAKGQGRSLEDVLRDAFFVRPDQLKGYEEYTLELDNKVKNDMEDHYNKLIQLLTIDDLYQDYDDVDYADNHVINAKRSRLHLLQVNYKTSYR
uniref:Protein kinase domain-containing protein n=1 Tax=Biomphalaria glabrata TaxID=6526 RepID=A0A2C9M4Y3_BIOGL